MTKRDFFKVAIRFIALFSLLSSILQIFPALISYSSYSTDMRPTYLIIVVILVIVILFLVFRLLFIYTDTIIDWLKLDRNFDDDRIVLGDLNLEYLMRTALVIFGIYLLLINLPDFLADLVYLFRSKIDYLPL